jgi:hypothetical protein
MVRCLFPWPFALVLRPATRHMKWLILALNFIFLYKPYDRSIIREINLCPCSMWRYMRDFLFIFFKQFTIYLSCIVNKENICTHEPLYLNLLLCGSVRSSIKVVFIKPFNSHTPMNEGGHVWCVLRVGEDCRRGRRCLKVVRSEGTTNMWAGIEWRSCIARASLLV